MNTSEPSEGTTDCVRSAPEIARRALALFGVVGVGLGTDRAEVFRWLQTEGLQDSLTPREGLLLDGPSPSGEQLVDAGWQSEALLMLLWALKRIDVLPAANVQFEPSMLRALLPPYTDEPVNEFVASAVRRDQDELIAMADQMLDLHWQARDAALNPRPDAAGIDIEIIQERHWGINWVIGYDRAAWDEVTTDT